MHNLDWETPGSAAPGHSGTRCRCIVFIAASTERTQLEAAEAMLPHRKSPNRLRGLRGRAARLVRADGDADFFEVKPVENSAGLAEGPSTQQDV